MNSLTKILLLVLGISFILSCAARERIVIPADVPEDHPHKYACTRHVGDNHVHFHVDHRKGNMYVLVTDISEDPIQLPLKKINAEIITPDGTMRTLELYASGIRMRRHRHKLSTVPYLYSAYYARHADWLKNIHEFLVELEIPIEDKTYVVSFEYKTSPKEDIHHRYR